MTIEDLMKNADFNARLQSAKDMGEVAALFQAEGFDTDETALTELLKYASPSDELNEDTLETVAGGISGKWPWNRAQDTRNKIEIAYWLGRSLRWW